MRVISRDIVEKEGFIRGIIPVFSLLEDAEEVNAKIVEPLTCLGYKAEQIEHVAALCQSLTFAQKVRDVIKHSRCGILVFSKALLKAENDICRQMMFYEFGQMEGQRSDIYPFLLDASSNDLEQLFKGMPVANVQGVDSLEKILAALAATKVPKERYLEDLALNNLVAQRIKHVRLTVIFDIWQSTLRTIWCDDEIGWGEPGGSFDEKAIETMIESLFDDLQVGALVVRFGKKETIEQEPFFPYLEESGQILFDSPAQFEKTTSPKHLEYDLEKPLFDSDDSILTTIKLEFHIPVHDILGSSYAPYLSVKHKSRWKTQQLQLLLAESGKGLAGGFSLTADEMHAQRGARESRLYFILPGPTVALDDDLVSSYGKTCNYIFPK
jgi:hypothetical protein